MHKSLEKIMAQYNLLPIADARALWITRARAESGRAEVVALSLAAAGLVPVADWDGSAILADGRTVTIVVDGIAYAATAEDHARRKSEAFAAKKQGKASADKAGEALTSVLCPVCQSAMAKSPVCPNCAQGKAGFKVLCICTECHHEVYL